VQIFQSTTKYKQSLKIPTRYSESVNRRKNNTITKWKRTNNDLQNIAHKTKDQVTGTPLNITREPRCSKMV